MANADLTMKQNDTWPPLSAVLTDGEGEPLDLTDVDAVHVFLSGPIKVKTGPCTIVGDPKEGAVEYPWQGAEGGDPADLHTAGSYKGEFEITYEDGSVQTVPNDSYFTIEVVADLGPE
jgi:hypothetical protein